MGETGTRIRRTARARAGPRARVRAAHIGLKITEYVENRSRCARARVDPVTRASQSTPPVFDGSRPIARESSYA